MTKLEAYKYYTEELAKHGWHVLHMLHVDDVKDRIKESADIVEMPSDAILNDVCAYVANNYCFEDYSFCVDWAIDMTYEWKEATT